MSPPELRGLALLVLVCALASPSVAQFTYSFSAPRPGVSWSFTVPALLTADTTITNFDSSTGPGPNCTIPYVTISDPLGTPSVTTGLGSTCTFTGSWNKLRHQGYLSVPLFPSFNTTGTFIDPTQTATLTITGQIATPTITGTYYVEYFANNAAPLSGTPDQIIRVINVGLGGNPISNTGNICEAVYVFNADQVIQACCQCVLKPNELAVARVSADLTSSTLTGDVPSAGVVKIVLYPVGPQGPASSLVTATACDAAQSPMPTTGPVGVVPVAALGAVFGTHLQVEPTGTAVTETEKLPRVLSSEEAAFLPNACSFIRYLGSGRGTCRCTAGLVAQ